MNVHSIPDLEKESGEKGKTVKLSFPRFQYVGVEFSTWKVEWFDISELFVFFILQIRQPRIKWDFLWICLRCQKIIEWASHWVWFTMTKNIKTQRMWRVNHAESPFINYAQACHWRVVSCHRLALQLLSFPQTGDAGNSTEIKINSLNIMRKHLKVMQVH